MIQIHIFFSVSMPSIVLIDSRIQQWTAEGKLDEDGRIDDKNDKSVEFVTMITGFSF